MLIKADAQHIPLKDKTIDAIITDPPYGLEFMGKDWDAPHKARIRERVDLRTNPKDGKSTVRTPESYTAGAAFQEWVAEWASECLRVCKPGAFLLAFGGTRTFHRLTCGLEDAGWEIRDCVMWLYGSGFPKSLDVSKAIDKESGKDRRKIDRMRVDGRATGNHASGFISGVATVACCSSSEAITKAAKEWRGWHTALKPAWEPIIMARKPLERTVAQNVQKWGTGAMNIDECRIGTDHTSTHVCYTRKGNEAWQRPWNQTGLPAETHTHNAPGRWPANLILDEEAANLLDAQSGVLTSGRNPSRRSADKHRDVYAGWKGEQTCLVARDTDSGYASRFFYTAKASRSERGRANTHPTVKPIALMEYLIKLVTRPGALILDPFAGSGSTLIAAQNLGRHCMAIDKDYQELAAERIGGSLFKHVVNSAWHSEDCEAK